jgi:hypothetical protein
MRYYFSIAEFKNKENLSELSINQLYDQAEVEAAPADGVLSGPYQYDASYDPDIYYIEVKWDGYKIANSNKKYQLALGLYYGDTWDPTNDWSYQGITKCVDTYQNGSETRTDYICVYSDGVLVGGIEPDGSTPVVTTTATTEPSVTTTTTAKTTTTTASETTISQSDDTTTTTSGITTTTTTTTTGTTGGISDCLYGDINLDGRVDITDAVLLNKAAASAVTLNALASRNADCNGDGEVGTADATTLMKFLVRLIDTLPETA